MPSEQPVMKPQCRQIRLQWVAITALPHISQRGPLGSSDTDGRSRVFSGAADDTGTG